MSIDIKGLDKAELLAALYNSSQPLGLGFLQADTNAMTKEDATEIIREQGLSFDYLQGRVMKISLEGDNLNPWGYDRDNGEGSVAQIVENLKNGIEVQPENSAKFRKGLDDFLDSAEPTTIEKKGQQASVNLGINDELKIALKDARKKFETPNGNDGGPN